MWCGRLHINIQSISCVFLQNAIHTFKQRLKFNFKINKCCCGAFSWLCIFDTDKHIYWNDDAIIVIGIYINIGEFWSFRYHMYSMPMIEFCLPTSISIVLEYSIFNKYFFQFFLFLGKFETMTYMNVMHLTGIG